MLRVDHRAKDGRAVLKDFVLHLPSPGAEPEVSLSPGALALKSTIVLPDGRRRLLFPWPHGFQPVQATVSTALRH